MNRLLSLIFIAMILGVLTGAACHELLAAPAALEAAGWFQVVTDAFLRLIKMIIAPLVFSTLVAGIAHMGDAAAVGRVGLKTIGWFLLASMVSLGMGLIMVDLLQPGVGLNIAAPPPAAAVDPSRFSLQEFVTHLFPRSIFEAMANNEILQIVVFSVFVGAAVAALDDKAPQVLSLVEQFAAIMLKVTGYVMKLAPVAIFAALAATVTKYGLEILWTYGKFVLGFYVSLALLWALLICAAAAVVGRRSLNLIAAIREPVLLAFSTASSEAAYPKTLEQLVKWGVPRRIVSFILPLGYSFNVDGTMMYLTFATIFIAQVYGVAMSVGQQITMLLLLMVMSKGVAGVPRASMVVMAATLAYFGLPAEGLALILAVDQLLDMGRSATNVVGNSVACVVVARWENGRDRPSPVGE